MDKDTRNIIATATGAALTMGLPFLRVHPLIALLFGLAGFFLVRQILPVREPGEEERPTALPPELLPALQKRVLQEGSQTAAHLDGLAGQIQRRETAAAVQDIARLIRAIGAELQDNPQALASAETLDFLQDNLQRARELVGSYARIATTRAPEPSKEPRLEAERQRTLQSAEETIERLRRGFAELLQECMENNLRLLQEKARQLSGLLEEQFPTTEARQRDDGRGPKSPPRD